VLSLDDCLEYITDDELVEVTPKSIRMRKRILGTEDRKKDRKVRSLAAVGDAS
jgi:GTP-binding protein